MNGLTEEHLNKSNKHNFVKTALIICVIALAGFGIRVINLGEPGFGTDEPLHVYAAKSLLENGKPELPSGVVYGRAILYSKLVALSFKVLGTNEFAARFPSVIFGTLTIVLLFFIGNKFWGTRVGLISALLVAFIPYQIAWSRECRMYTMFQFFFLAGAFAFYYGLENLTDGKSKNVDQSANKHSLISRFLYIRQIDWKWIGLSAILLYISYSLQELTAIFGPSIMVYLVMMGFVVAVSKSWGDFLRSKYLFLISIIIVSGLLALIFVPGVLQFAKTYLFSGPNWGRRLKFNPLYYLKFLTSTSLFPLGAFLVLGSIQVVTHKNKAGFYAFICTVVPLVILTFIPSKVRGSRYIFNILPLVILVASYSINNLFNAESDRISELLSKHKMSGYNTVLSYIIIVLVLLYTAGPWAYYSYRNLFDFYSPDNIGMAHRNWRQACDYIKKHSKPGDVTVPSEPLTVHYYGGTNIHYYIANDYTYQPQFTVKDEKRVFNIKDLKNVVSKHSRGWLIMDSGRFYSPFLVTKDLREYIFNTLAYHDVVKDRTVLIFSWDERNTKRF